MQDKSIGDIIRETNNLTPDQVEKVLAHQKQHNLRFGEAAVALGFAKREDIMWALSQQFQYPYSHSQSPENKLNPELVVATQPFERSAEVFRDLRATLINSLFQPDQARRAIAVVSANVGDGKSYFAANLAIAFSQLGGRTLLVDADMRTPRQHQMFDVKNASSGLSGVLSGRSENNVIKPVVDLPSLYLLPVGVVPPNPTELVQRPVFGALMRELLAKFDHVIVDTPAAAHGSDARVIAASCGAAVLIGRQGQSQVAQVKKLQREIEKTSAKVVGVVLNTH